MRSSCSAGFFFFFSLVVPQEPRHPRRRRRRYCKPWTAFRRKTLCPQFLSGNDPALGFAPARGTGSGSGERVVMCLGCWVALAWGEAREGWRTLGPGKTSRQFTFRSAGGLAVEVGTLEEERGCPRSNGLEPRCLSVLAGPRRCDLAGR